MEYEVHVEQVVKCHEENWVNKDFLVQKSLYLHVVSFFQGVVVELDLVKVPFGVVEFVYVLGDVPVGEVVLQEESRKFVGLVISDWQDVVLVEG